MRSHVVVVDLCQVAIPVFQECTADVALEDLLVGELIADPDELVFGQLQRLQDLLERLPQVFPGEQAIQALDRFQAVLAREPPAADVQAGQVGGAAEAELQEFEVVVNACLVVVQILVIDNRTFVHLLVALDEV